MDERDKRQLSLEYDLDDIVEVDLPLWYLRLTAPIAGQWKREVGLVVAVFAMGLIGGTLFGVALAGRLG